MRRLLAVSLIAAGSGPSLAASATAQASAQVVEPVQVIGLLGTPLTLADVLAALQSVIAGPNTGSRLIRLAAIAPPEDPMASNLGVSDREDSGVTEAMSNPVNGSAGAGTLQGALAAAVSVAPGASRSGQGEGGGGPASITVAFN